MKTGLAKESSETEGKKKQKEGRRKEERGEGRKKRGKEERLKDPGLCCPEKVKLVGQFIPGGAFSNLWHVVRQ